MAEKTHEALVDTQFGARADEYLTSPVHSQGPDLDTLAALVAGRSEARVLDLGCGGGHVSFRVAPAVREVVAYDLSAEMLGVVGRAAKERGFANLVTRQGVAERLPFERQASISCSAAGVRIIGAISMPACARPRGC